MNPELMQIGELAEKAGVSHRTIHYYERLGLLKPAYREGSGYRYYDSEAAKRLDKIVVLKNLGLSLDEIASIIDLYFVEGSELTGKKKLLEILQKQLDQTDKQIAQLQCFRNDIVSNQIRIQALVDKLATEQQ